ncbi:MAG: PaaI family thioesterase [Thermoplasmata archaeon]|nr:PaaI family thioesterase [Candidatus Sysuiplasma acidicola]MBX8645634.1 PaaI family thioesterase [Candidatus Sysuiplasma acidicola]MDH2905145.1 PaaI family thioesterase [Methanomassiliicoccales archaeon]
MDRKEDSGIFGSIASIIRGDPYLRSLDVQVLEMEKGHAKLMLPGSDRVLRHGGIVNGGAICTLMDAAGGTATATVNTGKNQVTIELKVNFLEPVKKGNMYCAAEVIRAGKNIVVVKMDLTDADGVLCASGIGTWMILHEDRFPARKD